APPGPRLVPVSLAPPTGTRGRLALNERIGDHHHHVAPTMQDLLKRSSAPRRGARPQLAKIALFKGVGLLQHPLTRVGARAHLYSPGFTTVIPGSVRPVSIPPQPAIAVIVKGRYPVPEPCSLEESRLGSDGEVAKFIAIELQVFPADCHELHPLRLPSVPRDPYLTLGP